MPSKNPSFIPSLGPTLTAAPTPCQDDLTYTSRLGFECLFHANYDCGRLVIAGYTLEEVDELLVRCQKSYDSCWLFEPPSELPSTVPSMIPSSLPSLLPSYIPSSTSSEWPSTLPSS